MSTIVDLILKASSHAEWDAPRCVYGCSADLGITADGQRWCEPCALEFPRRAMTTSATGLAHQVHLGDQYLGEAVRHPSDRWRATAVTPEGVSSWWADSLDDALDLIAEGWGWER